MDSTKYLWDVDAIDAADTSRFGGKASGLARMRQMGLPVPPAVVISTDAFKAYRDSGGVLPSSLSQEIDEAISLLESRTGKIFCGNGVPLLLSVRSGAKISMPGMMDTILNLGLNAKSAAAFAAASHNREFVGDTWLRFWAMYADTVLGIDTDEMHEDFSARFRESKQPAEALFAELEMDMLAVIEEECGECPSTSPRDQLERAVRAVFESWDSPRAKAYRKHHGISNDLGTAVVVQAMVFGNLDDESGTGVAFTRDPITGERTLFGEYLAGHQGEDLVAGTKTPDSLSAPSSEVKGIAEEVKAVGEQLEKIYKDALDIEFTVERGRLHLLQVRSAKRTATAAVRIAVEMVSEGLIQRHEALKRISNEQLSQLVRPNFVLDALEAANHDGRFLVAGIPASPGHASGIAVLDSDRAVEQVTAGRDVILVRPTTSPLDVRGMLHSQGVVTARGGSASHAAVVARALDKPCIVGCGTLEIDEETRTFRVGERMFVEGDEISIDGKTGRIYAGVIPLDKTGASSTYLTQLLSWAEEASGTTVWCSAKMAGEAGSIARRHPAGIGIVPVVDLLIANGQVSGLASAVQALSANAAASNQEIEQQFTPAVSAVCHEFLRESGACPVAFRLPRLSGSRARHMVEGWGALEPTLLLANGAPRINNALLSGISEAANGTRRQGVSVLLPAACDVKEVEVFAMAVRPTGNLRAGVLVQNAALLSELAGTQIADVDVWIDLPEIIRTFHGWPDEMSFSAEVIDRYASAGNLTGSPIRVLHGYLHDCLIELAKHVEQGATRVVIDIGASPADEMIRELYQLGFRSFSVPQERLESLRFMLGQIANSDAA